MTRDVARCWAARLMAAAFLALWLLPAAGQIRLPGAAASAPAAPHDPLARETPRRAVTGFVLAASHENYALAARYLQLNGALRPHGEALARQLGELMDRYFLQPLTDISDAPQGSLSDGLSLDRERVGPLRIAGESQYVELVRVEDPVYGQIWLVTSQTLAQVPLWHADMQETWIERVLPSVLSQYTLFDVTVAQIAIWAASLLLPLLLLPLVFGGLLRLARWLAPHDTYREFISAWYRGTRGPVLAIATLAIHGAAIPAFGTSLEFRTDYGRLVLYALVVAAAWMLLRVSALAFGRTAQRLQRRGHAGTRSVMLLSERLFKVAVLVAAVLAVLAIAGVNITAALAGLGIAGIAVALGAQKTVENVLGAILLLGDEAIAVGDTCSISGRVGTVEDITLRSVRVRTVEQTLLSIPAGVLAEASIENFASRGKILARHQLRIAYGISVTQLRGLLEDVRALVARHPHIEQGSARVRLTDFALPGIEVELFAYFLTKDWLEFLALREDFMLQVALLVEGRGAAFALPFSLPPQLQLPRDGEPLLV